VPLQLASPPSRAYELLAESLSRVSTAGGAAETFANVADPSRLNAALAHQVFSLGATDIAQGSHIERAKLVAWRFLLQNGAKTIGAAELACDSRGGNLRFSSLDTGPFAQATRNAVDQAERLNSVRDGRYELRVLRAPAIYVMALWLKNLQGPQDIVIPIQAGSRGPASAGGAPLPQSAGEFVRSLRPVAAEELAFDSSPPPPPER
jgi:hypothetical protein